MNAQEKRAEQLKALGIEETEISKDVIQSTGGETASQALPRGERRCHVRVK